MCNQFALQPTLTHNRIETEVSCYTIAMYPRDLRATQGIMRIPRHKRSTQGALGLHQGSEAHTPIKRLGA